MGEAELPALGQWDAEGDPPGLWCQLSRGHRTPDVSAVWRENRVREPGVRTGSSLCHEARKHVNVRRQAGRPLSHAEDTRVHTSHTAGTSQLPAHP